MTIRFLAPAAVVCVMVASTVAPAQPTGRVTAHVISSKRLHADRRVWVYTPPGYDSSARAAYDVIVAFDGEEYQDDMPLPAMLDSLAAAGQIRPKVALLIDNGASAARLADLANRAAFAAFLGDEAMPWLRAHYAVTRDPRRTIVTGSSAGGLAAVYVAFGRPDLFGNVLAQSAALWRGNEASNDAPYEWLTAQYRAAPKKRIRFFLDVGGLETRGALGGAAPSILEANRRFKVVLDAKGYSVVYTEVPNGVHAPTSWAPRLPIGLVTLDRGEGAP